MVIGSFFDHNLVLCSIYMIHEICIFCWDMAHKNFNWKPEYKSQVIKSNRDLGTQDTISQTKKQKLSTNYVEKNNTQEKKSLNLEVKIKPWIFRIHTFQHLSSSKRAVCNEPSIPPTFFNFSLWKPKKCTLQDILLSQNYP